VRQAGILAAQALDLAIARIGRLAPSALGLQALRALPDKRFAPLAELCSIQAVASQPGALLAMRQRIGLREQALLLGSGKRTAGGCAAQASARSGSLWTRSRVLSPRLALVRVLHESER